MKLRVLAASSAAAVAAALLAGSPASAHSTDDWFSGTAPEWVDETRTAESTAGYVRQKTQISWSGFGVVVRAAVSDQKNDGFLLSYNDYVDPTDAIVAMTDALDSGAADRVVLDLRTVLPEQDDVLIEALHLLR